MEVKPFPRIFVTGAAGFVGSAIVDSLLENGFGVNALTRSGTLKQEEDEHVRIIKGDLDSPEALDEGMAYADAVIHLVGIIREKASSGTTFQHVHVEGTRSVIEAAKRAGVRRYLHMSALGARADAVSEYHKTKFRAERLVYPSTLDWTVFRPSLIHGPGGEFLKMEAGWARGTKPPFVFMPYFGGGLLGFSRPTLVQPIFVQDVARAFVEAIDLPKTIGNIYCLGGADRMTWPQMHHRAAHIFTGRRRLAMPLPAWYASAMTHIVPDSLLPFTRDQVTMAREDNSCDMDPFAADFGWEPGGFESTLASYAGSV
jgi:NADH dehydrogenase